MRTRMPHRCVKRSTPEPDPLIAFAKAVVADPARFLATERERSIVAALLAEATR